MFNNLKSKLGVGLVGLGGLVSVPAFAVADYSAITDAADYEAAGTAIVVIFAAVAVMYIAWKGGKMVLAALR